MVIGNSWISLQFQDGEYDDLKERNKLSIDQPDINQANVGCGGQLLHHAELTWRVEVSLLYR